MLHKLAAVEARYEELNRKLADPEVTKSQKLLRELSIEHSDLEKVVTLYRELKRLLAEVEDNRQIVLDGEDAELAALAKEELKALEPRREALEEQLRKQLLPKDPNDQKNVFIEVRAGTGGDEAALFCGELFRMYANYAETCRFKVEVVSSSSGTQGGYKEVIAMIQGQGAYSTFKYESGVHRVQRVPATENQGRIHTSAVTVAVLPEAEEVEIDLPDKDLRVDVYRSSGPGGQSVNTTDSAVRVTHLPTGLMVAIQDEKSQHKNKAKALRVLRARLLEIKRAEEDAKRSAERRSMVGSGDRSEKVRTYNFPQDRLTDHRIGLTIHNLQTILGGAIGPVIDALRTHFQAEALKSGGA